jgi:hypothetical protein
VRAWAITARSIRRPAWFVALVVLVPVACGRDVGSVSGTVRFQDKAVGSGTVLLVGSDGLPRYGNIQADGSYQIKRAPAGPARLAVNSPDPAKAAQIPTREQPPKNLLPAEKLKQLAPPRRPPAADRSTWFPLPAQYGDPNASGLAVEVKRGTNALDLNLK